MLPARDVFSQKGSSAASLTLHVAAEASHIGVAMVLLSAGADQDLTAQNGKKPVELATRQVAALLEQKCTDFPFYEWLSARGLEQFAGIFSAHAIDFDVLLHLDEKHLAEMEIPLGAPRPAAYRAWLWARALTRGCVVVAGRRRADEDHVGAARVRRRAQPAHGREPALALTTCKYPPQI